MFLHLDFQAVYFKSYFLSSYYVLCVRAGRSINFIDYFKCMVLIDFISPGNNVEGNYFGSSVPV